MLVNQVSTKDLFSSNPGIVLANRYGHSNISDSAFDSSQSNSQMMSGNSQMEQFSQFSSQDERQLGFSQQPPNEYYQRYMSKGPLFPREDSQDKNSLSMNKLSSYQQLQLHKTKARQRDERDLLNTIVSTVRDCAEEIKNTGLTLKETMADSSSVQKKELSDCLDQFQKKLVHHQDHVVTLIEKRDEERTKISDLELQIAVKAACVRELENKVSELEKEKSDRIISHLKGEYVKQQELTRQCLEELYERHQHQLEKQVHFQEKHQQQTHKQLEHERKHQQVQLHQLEQRLCNELASTNQKTQIQNGDLRQKLEMQFQEVQARQKQELLSSVERYIQESQMNSGHLQNQQLEKLYLNHKRELEQLVKDQIKSHANNQEQHTQTQIQQLSDFQQKERTRIEKELTLQFEIMQKKLQQDTIDRQNQEVEQLRKKHQQEVDRLKAEQRSHTSHPPAKNRPYTAGVPSNNFQNVSSRIPPPNTTEHFTYKDPLALHYDVQSTSSWIRAGQKHPQYQTYPKAFVSPIGQKTQWSSKTLFGRSNPSPIATVFPQKQNQQQTSTSVTISQAGTSVVSVSNVYGQRIQLTSNNDNSTETLNQIQSRNAVKIMSPSPRNLRSTTTVLQKPPTKGKKRRKAHNWGKSKKGKRAKPVVNHSELAKFDDQQQFEETSNDSYVELNPVGKEQTLSMKTYSKYDSSPNRQISIPPYENELIENASTGEFSVTVESPGNEANTTPAVQSNSLALDVYDFNDEVEKEDDNWLSYDFAKNEKNQFKRKSDAQNRKCGDVTEIFNKLFSSTEDKTNDYYVLDSDDSRHSSPSVSVTSVVLKRRIKKEKKDQFLMEDLRKSVMSVEGPHCDSASIC